MSRENVAAYIGKCPGCKQVIAATVDAPEYRDDVAKDVAEWIRDGLIVERSTVGEARKLFNNCACNSEKPLPLFSQETPNAPA
jgi:hypothetical protein